jgi:hypothetical protein
MPDEPKTDSLRQPTGGQAPSPTTAQEEWGDRVETGRDIARGGKESGAVPGATGDDPADPRSGQGGSGRG